MTTRTTNKHTSQGFTLAELLIVVAIIAVLVAIAIPIFTNQRDKAKLAVDQYNVRAAKSAAAVEYMSSGASGEKTYYYNGTSVQEDATGIDGYGKSTSKKFNTQTGAFGVPVDDNGNAGYVIATVSSDGNVALAWNTSGDSSGTAPTFGGVTGTDWNSAKLNSQYGISFPAGKLVAEGNDLYLFFANKTYYAGDYREKSLADVYNTGSMENCVLKISADTPIYNKDDFLSKFNGKIVPAGTVVNDNGTYLCLASSYKVDQWNLPSAGNNNWNKVT